MKNPNYQVTKEQHQKELESRVPPIVNVDVILYHEGKYLLGKHKRSIGSPNENFWLFPGSRMHWDETPQETALRVAQNELPGVRLILRRLVSVASDKGWDDRANGITLYYLCEYLGGAPVPNDQMIAFRWLTREEFLISKDVYNIDQQLANDLDVAVRTINMSEDEWLTEVDNQDQEIGKIIKKEAHLTAQRYHRAAHIMIFTSTGDVVLQQRSWNKSSSPGKWDMPGGHQAFGQTIEQCAQAELTEEMGISTSLHFIGKKLYQNSKQAEFSYLYAGISDGPYGFDKNEVEQIKVFDCEKLLKHEYEECPEILDHVYQYIEELRSFWEPLGNSATIKT